MYLTIDRNKILRTIGWTSIGVGLFLISISLDSEPVINSTMNRDGVIDADFTIIDE
jgi:hypothetical protein